MEYEITNKKKPKRLPTITGFLSFCIALISLTAVNVLILSKSQNDMIGPILMSPLLGFFLGIIGLFTRKHSRLYAVWGLSLNVFLLVFYFVMIIASLGINYKP